MSGHSKWNNIKGRKNAQDAKRGKIFQKLSREIYMAAKNGGADPDSNAALRLAMDKARAENMPKDNVERAIKKATDTNSGDHYDELTFEGYGPGGVAILVHTLTDNKNRTQTNVRVAFTRNGGNLGETGSVAYQFERKGDILIDKKQINLDEDTLFEKAIDLGAEDVQSYDEYYEIITDTASFMMVKEGLESDGVDLAQAAITMLPQNKIPLDAVQEAKLAKLVDALEEDDDVAEVFTNAE